MMMRRGETNKEGAAPRRGASSEERANLVPLELIPVVYGALRATVSEARASMADEARANPANLDRVVWCLLHLREYPVYLWSGLDLVEKSLGAIPSMQRWWVKPEGYPSAMVPDLVRWCMAIVPDKGKPGDIMPCFQVASMLGWALPLVSSYGFSGRYVPTIGLGRLPFVEYPVPFVEYPERDGYDGSAIWFSHSAYTRGRGKMCNALPSQFQIFDDARRGSFKFSELGVVELSFGARKQWEGIPGWLHFLDASHQE